MQTMPSRICETWSMSRETRDIGWKGPDVYGNGSDPEIGKHTKTFALASEHRKPKHSTSLPIILLLNQVLHAPPNFPGNFPPLETDVSSLSVPARPSGILFKLDVKESSGDQDRLGNTDTL
jgi:hypothetical protein